MIATAAIRPRDPRSRLGDTQSMRIARHSSAASPMKILPAITIVPPEAGALGSREARDPMVVGVVVSFVTGEPLASISRSILSRSLFEVNHGEELDGGFARLQPQAVLLHSLEQGRYWLSRSWRIIRAGPLKTVICLGGK